MHIWPQASIHIATKAVDLDLVPGRSPISVAAAAIYMACSVRMMSACKVGDMDQNKGQRRKSSFVLRRLFLFRRQKKRRLRRRSGTLPASPKSLSSRRTSSCFRERKTYSPNLSSSKHPSNICRRIEIRFRLRQEISKESQRSSAPKSESCGGH